MSMNAPTVEFSRVAQEMPVIPPDPAVDYFGRHMETKLDDLILDEGPVKVDVRVMGEDGEASVHVPIEPGMKVVAGEHDVPLYYVARNGSLKPYPQPRRGRGQHHEVRPPRVVRQRQKAIDELDAQRAGYRGRHAAAPEVAEHRKFSFAALGSAAIGLFQRKRTADTTERKPANDPVMDAPTITLPAPDLSASHRTNKPENRRTPSPHIAAAFGHRQTPYTTEADTLVMAPVTAEKPQSPPALEPDSIETGQYYPKTREAIPPLLNTYLKEHKVDLEAAVILNNFDSLAAAYRSARHDLTAAINAGSHNAPELRAALEDFAEFIKPYINGRDIRQPRTPR